jgi:hypothetical protein
LSLLWRCSENYNTIRFYHSRDVVLTIIIQKRHKSDKNVLYYNCQNNVTRVIKTNCIIIVRTASQEWHKRIAFCHSCDVVLTIIIQFVFVSLVTLFWKLQHNSFLSLSWRCSDNYNTILFVNLVTFFCYNCQNNVTRVTKTNGIIIVRKTSQDWQRELYYNCQNNV